ncbi:MAG: FHA domain-containing protein [Acidobacteriota bacterium]
MKARHVVLAIGRAPRRFDIPGNTDGIAYRRADAGQYVGEPACVIGGGTSAAEAVIAISNAKVAAGDTTAVYWSYRGDKMPRVSKALAEVFFEAYVGNGNIRYHPQSDPAAVVTGDDKREYLSVRVDRRIIPGRPSESTSLEFPKERCIACIGEDIPEALLGSLGIQMIVGGPSQKKRMVVTRHLETEQPNVYLIGDILSQIYLEADDFRADPRSFREVKHRGNIKAALWDGVIVAEVIHQKLQGKTDIKVAHPDDAAGADDARPKPLVAVAKPITSDELLPAAVLAPERRPVQADAFLVRMLPTGVQDMEYPLWRDRPITIGKQDCDILFPEDVYLAPRHCTVSFVDGAYVLRDEGSDWGVFRRAPAGQYVEVKPGDLVQVGRQYLYAQESDDGGFHLAHVDGSGRAVATFRITDRAQVFGRSGCDAIIPDKSVSRRHFAAMAAEGRLLIKDLKSANKTLLRVKGAIRLEQGMELGIGRQVLVVNLKEAAAAQAIERTIMLAAHADAPPIPARSGPVAMPAAPAAVPKPAPAPAPAPPTRARRRASSARTRTGRPRPAPAPAPAAAKPAAPAAAAAPSVTFKGVGTFPVPRGKTICEVAEENDVPISAECHAGICGSDPIKIVSGQEFLSDEADDGEREALEDICGLQAGPCRLACVLKVKGPIVVEIVPR